MAKPKYHVIATLLLFIFLSFAKPPENIQITGMNFIILWFFGVLIDVDHIYEIGWFKKFIKNEKVAPPKGWKNRLHTFKSLAVIITMSIIAGIYLPDISNFLPLLAYGVHMIIDGANRANNGPWKNEGSYLPWVINKFFPDRLKWYCYEEKA